LNKKTSSQPATYLDTKHENQNYPNHTTLQKILNRKHHCKVKETKKLLLKRQANHLKLLTIIKPSVMPKTLNQQQS
jgi:hypothetical protein